jgi:hypothetical protein
MNVPVPSQVVKQDGSKMQERASKTTTPSFCRLLKTVLPSDLQQHLPSSLASIMLMETAAPSAQALSL